MIVRKILLAAGAAALMSTPTWALASQTPSNPGTDHGQGTTTTNTGDPGHSGDPHGKGNGNHGQGHHGASHKCAPHSVGYVAGGTLVSQTLTKNSDGSYSGEVTVEVTHTNHHARGDKGKTVVYKVTSIQVTFGMSDVNSDGTVGLDDLAKGDRAHVIGKITALAKKCNQSEFTAATTIHRIVFHAPLG